MAGRKRSRYDVVVDYAPASVADAPAPQAPWMHGDASSLAEAGRALLQGAQRDLGEALSEHLRRAEEALRAEVDRLERDLRAAQAETARIRAQTEELLRSPLLARLEEARTRLNSIG